MRKFGGAIIYLMLILLMLPNVGLAGATAATVTVRQVDAADYFYPLTFDNLVLDFVLGVDSADTLKTIILKNEGTALPVNEIERLVMYRDSGDALFQGFAVDEEIAVATYDYSNLVWVFQNINNVVSPSARYFVTAETRKNGSNNKSFQFSIPAYSDTDGDGAYDIGDYGIYFASKVAVPTEKVVNDKVVTFKATTVDSTAPVVVMTNLVDGQVIKDSNFILTGKGKDQGGGVIAELSVCVNTACVAATNTGTNFATWEYKWNNIVNGKYSVYLKVKDFSNNQIETAVINVTKSGEQTVSAANSKVEFDKLTVQANGDDAIRVTVTVKDTEDKVFKDKTVYFAEYTKTGIGVVDAEKKSDENGQVVFVIRSGESGMFKVSILVDGGIMLQDKQEIVFTPIETYTSGTWVKLADQKAVYFLDAKNVRHAYPTQAVWESYFGTNFSSVKTIDADTMASYTLGKNVPFKYGTLMKIPSVPRVYEVRGDGVMRWVKSEATAKTLYGADWASKVKDLPESFFTDYKAGSDLE